MRYDARSTTQGDNTLSQHVYHLQDTIPGDAIAEKWQNLVAQQARVLDLMLRSLRTNLDTLRSRTDLSTQSKIAQLEALASATTQGLANLAQQLVGIEQKLAAITKHHVTLQALPPEQGALVYTLEQVISILHANLTAARHALLHMFQASNTGGKSVSE